MPARTDSAAPQPPRRARRRLRVATFTTLALVLASLWAAPAAGADGAPADTPTAQSIDGVASVGPLFGHGLGSAHTCTASVVASPGGNVIVTAAHCLSGNVAGWQFAPGYDAGKTPYGVWTITQAYVDPAWIADQDPGHDYAFLVVADQEHDGSAVSVQDVTGGNLLGVAPPAGAAVTVVAYNGGLDDRAISCTAAVYYTDGSPGFDCQGYVGGSSGSPLVVQPSGMSTGFVVGVIGGPNQGGCVDYTSYSSTFGPDVYRLWLRAALGVDPDVPPTPGGDGC